MWTHGLLDLLFILQQQTPACAWVHVPLSLNLTHLTWWAHLNICLFPHDNQCTEEIANKNKKTQKCFKQNFLKTNYTIKNFLAYFYSNDLYYLQSLRCPSHPSSRSLSSCSAPSVQHCPAWSLDSSIVEHPGSVFLLLQSFFKEIDGSHSP